MKSIPFPKLIATCIASLAALALALPTNAEDAKEIELTGTGLCAKCALNETEKCTSAIVVETDDKKVTYYMKENDVAKAFHGKICQGKHPITAKGTVSEKDGQHYLEATEIALVETKEE